MDKRRRWPATVWMVRHGESVANAALLSAVDGELDHVDVIGRDADVRLTGRGEEQARAAGRWFGSLPPERRPERVLASPYRRARRTAEIIIEEAGLDVELRVDERLGLLVTGCVGGLLGGGRPVQQYRLTEAPGDPLPMALPESADRLALSSRPVRFSAEIDGDRILTATGPETAYLKNARWVAPAPSLFDAALRAAFRDFSPDVALLPGADGSGPGCSLDVEVVRFEADYVLPGAVPTIAIEPASSWRARAAMWWRAGCSAATCRRLGTACRPWWKRSAAPRATSFGRSSAGRGRSVRRRCRGRAAVGRRAADGRADRGALSGSAGMFGGAPRCWTGLSLEAWPTPRFGDHRSPRGQAGVGLSGAKPLARLLPERQLRATVQGFTGGKRGPDDQ